MNTHLIEKIKKEIENFAPTVETEGVGRVVKTGDGIAEIVGLPKAIMGEMVLFDETGTLSLEEAMKKTDALYGVLLNLEEDSVKAMVLGDASRVREDMVVRGLGKVLSVPVGEALIGRVVNALGEPIDGKGALKTTTYNPIERDSYGVIDRKAVNTPLHTGIKAIDSMIPIGRGQRELIIGDRAVGKTTIAIDTILNQQNEPKENRPVCIYVSIGQKDSKTARIVHELASRGAMEYTIVVDASASAPAALQFLAPYAGAAIGEYFMEKGQDALVIYDDLSKQAVAYRQLSLLLRRPPGREAYPGDIFYLHSRLLERAARLSDEKGGGSLTALPIIETLEGDVSAYIPTNVISITDGQIYLMTDLYNRGIRPAIDAGISVSRVGSSAQTKAMKKVAGRIRLDLAQFRELEAFAQFSSDLDPDTKKRIEAGQKMVELLKQGKHAPYPFEKQAVLFYAANKGHLDTVPVSKIAAFEEALLVYIESTEGTLFEKIKSAKEFTDDIAGSVDAVLSRFAETHPDLYVA